MMRFAVPGARVEAHRTGTILGLFGKSGDFGGELLDLSGLGLRFLSREKVNLEARLKVSVSFPQTKDKLDCAGVVRWTHAHNKPGLFVVGIEFDKLTDDQVTLLDKLQKSSGR